MPKLNSKIVKVPVSERALFARISRKLATEDEILKKTRPSRHGGLTHAQLDLGDYYTIATRLNVVCRKDVDLEDLGREIGVLADWEVLDVSEK